MASMQEAMREKELAGKRQELLLHPLRRGRIKRLMFACLFRTSKALVGKIFGFLLGRTATCTPHVRSPATSLVFASSMGLQEEIILDPSIALMGSRVRFLSSASCSAFVVVFGGKMSPSFPSGVPLSRETSSAACFQSFTASVVHTSVL
ncbi:hypothetical protein NL676_019536 [Syzygium grande]|nr:hypothetical protein NL676_019536 [Syzygium grande]